MVPARKAAMGSRRWAHAGVKRGNRGRSHAVARAARFGAGSPKRGGRVILTSTIDKTNREFAANAAHMRALTEELQQRRDEAAAGGPPRARERHVARGKLLPRDRVM